mmetsp:Transcript_7788/g.12596  ORF Transcript_7788/g.12596 Transcript_7788/m.12596 type:complete len:229 (+) Transcript_7788:264-950(+)|eukprot:CAMPEP_0203766090 /NCGR_PEP_ID=MMETSP0099_2-20121227/219_1 /ASSEMBLY_ACC=CAM_ASM_000209 /TAXON_ID=96639 /ORGANISM=" , Strain NY0313808BC1" /LENGTH=228 /DNA_ID=CAMNT_0050662391 /DNA_START=182 /DNA_END=868 /DNA_ORIENTATION=+
MDDEAGRLVGEGGDDFSRKAFASIASMRRSKEASDAKRSELAAEFGGKDQIAKWVAEHQDLVASGEVGEFDEYGEQLVFTASDKAALELCASQGAQVGKGKYAAQLSLCAKELKDGYVGLSVNGVIQLRAFPEDATTEERKVCFIRDGEELGCVLVNSGAQLVLRLEFGEGAVSGCVPGSYLSRLVGSTKIDTNEVQVKVEMCNNDESVLLERFQLLKLSPDRIQWKC